MPDARGLAAIAVAAALATVGLSACGGEDFANERRPPVPITITGVIHGARGHDLAQRLRRWPDRVDDLEPDARIAHA